MTDAPAQHSAPPPATVADVMQPPVTMVEQNDHVAAAAYMMKRADATALIVTQAQTGQPVGIITDADISHAVADGKNPNDVRIYQLMTASPTVVSTTTSVLDAARMMTSKRFRHLPVVGDTGLVGIVDITDVCRALLEPDPSEPPSGTGRADAADPRPGDPGDAPALGRGRGGRPSHPLTRRAPRSNRNQPPRLRAWTVRCPGATFGLRLTNQPEPFACPARARQLLPETPERAAPDSSRCPPGRRVRVPPHTRCRQADAARARCPPARAGRSASPANSARRAVCLRP